jgi:hypothetical protein
MTMIDNRNKEISAPSDPRRRQEIREFARRQVARHGVRQRLGEYYHPPEYARWREYYNYCLWREIQRAQARETTGPMTTAEVGTLADQYRAAGYHARYLILATAYTRAGRHGVEALAHAVGADPEAAIQAVEAWNRARRRARKGQKPAVVPPPPKPGTVFAAQAREVALEAVGGLSIPSVAPRSKGVRRASKTWDPDLGRWIPDA